MRFVARRFQPVGEICTVQSGSGTVAGADVTDVAVGCVDVAPALIAYVANAGSDDVTTFSIDRATGELSEVGAEVAAGDAPLSITVDPTGRFAYVANATSDDVTIFRIDPSTGVLSAVGKEGAGDEPRSVTVLGGTR